MKVIKESYWIILIVIIGLFVVNGYVRKSRLMKDFRIDKGKIIKVTAGGKTGGGIQFTYGSLNNKWNPLISPSNDCQKKVKLRLTELQNYSFPVVYQKDDHSNAEILLFKSQYAKYNIMIPEELISIVNEISQCE